MGFCSCNTFFLVSFRVFLLRYHLFKFSEIYLTLTEIIRIKLITRWQTTNELETNPIMYWLLTSLTKSVKHMNEYMVSQTIHSLKISLSKVLQILLTYLSATDLSTGCAQEL